MESLSDEVSVRQFRANMSAVLSKVGYAQERIGVTRNDMYIAMLISPQTLRVFERLERKADEEYQKLLLEHSPQGVAERHLFDAAFKLDWGRTETLGGTFLGRPDS